MSDSLFVTCTDEENNVYWMCLNKKGLNHCKMAREIYLESHGYPKEYDLDGSIYLEAEFMSRIPEVAKMLIDELGREQCLELIAIWSYEWSELLFKPSGEIGKYSYFMEKYVKEKIAIEIFNKLYNLRSSDKLNTLMDICQDDIKQIRREVNAK